MISLHYYNRLEIRYDKEFLKYIGSVISRLTVNGVEYFQHDTVRQIIEAPLGYADEFIKKLNDKEIPYQISDDREFYPLSFDMAMNPNFSPRGYQKEASQAMLEHSFGYLDAPTGSGKTNIAIYLIYNRQVKTLIIVPTSDLVNQTIDRLNQIMIVPKDKIGKFANGKKEVADITVGTWQSISKHMDKIKGQFGMVIADEFHKCFIAGTKIGNKNIEDIKIGDFVDSFNEKTKRIEKRKVVKTYKSKPKQLIVLKLNTKEKIICTPDHPFYIDGKWKKAIDLKTTDIMLCLDEVQNEKNNNLCDVFKKIRLENKIQKKLRAIKEKILQRGVFKKSFSDSKQKEWRETIRIQQEICKRENEKIQSYVRQENKGKAKSNPQGDGMETAYAGWKRARVDSSAKDAVACTGLACGISFKDNRLKRIQEKLSPESLQDRYSKQNFKSCNRSRRQLAQQRKGKAKGFKKNKNIREKWVESIEIQKQTSDGTFGRLCKDGFVYNIEVENNNNYFVNNVLVHNCGAKNYFSIVDNINAVAKFGISATPRRYDDKILLSFLFGSCKHKIPIERLYEEGYLIRPEIYFVKTKFEYIKSEIFNEWQLHNLDEMQLLGMLKKEIAEDDDRTEWIVDYIFDNRMKVNIVLAYEKKLAEELYNSFDVDHSINKVLLHGGLTSKEKKEAFKKINELDDCIIFGTQSLLGEGIDIPKLECLFLVSPTGAGNKTVQFTGRILRPFAGKKQVKVFDFVDQGDVYNMHYSRKKEYNRLKPIYK